LIGNGFEGDEEMSEVNKLPCGDDDRNDDDRFIEDMTIYFISKI